MPSRNESARTLARLELEAPISDDANLLNLQQHVEDFVREASVVIRQNLMRPIPASAALGVVSLILWRLSPMGCNRPAK
jgi:hypothetical protein